ncbi:N-acetylmuramoyl-L-alanine amidase [Salinicola avicenniae]|uniref:N-acetylmuramoyl-L-alanine amidase n=1 Tax=Salinicola avicenniae TaxID=2916836 RepID=UPI0020739DA7|nr:MULTISPECIES: N-acetylmuramoyl-L-alanine amidase [unclassified Salinicola]
MTGNPPRRCRRLATLLSIVLSLALLAGCATPSQREARDGYIADRTHHSSAYNQRIRYLVLHYTDSEAQRALKTLMGPHVSAHYLIPRHAIRDDEAPIVWQLVDERDRAWHAGVSAWRERTQLNDTSIGVEIVNAGPIGLPRGSQWQAYPPSQIDAVIALAKDIVTRYGLPPTAVLGHSDIAPSRKIDPGPRFPWRKLYEAGIGAWPRDSDVRHYRKRFRQCSPTTAQYQQALRAYGYVLSISGQEDAKTRDVTRAFQMHFRPEAYSGWRDDETDARLWALLSRYRPEALDHDATLSPDCGAGRDSQAD